MKNNQVYKKISTVNENNQKQYKIERFEGFTYWNYQTDYKSSMLTYTHCQRQSKIYIQRMRNCKSDIDDPGKKIRFLQVKIWRIEELSRSTQKQTRQGQGKNLTKWKICYRTFSRMQYKEAKKWKIHNSSYKIWIMN